MSDLTLNIKEFSGGVRFDAEPALLKDNQLADAQNFLPHGSTGAARKVKVWHKDLLNVTATGADDRITEIDPVIGDDATALAAADPFMPRFDRIEEVFYFYSNCFDDGTTNLDAPTATPNQPIKITGDNWVIGYNFYAPTTGDLTIKAGFFLYKDVFISADHPLLISVPVRQNGAYDAGEHIANADLCYINGTQPATQQASVTLNIGDLALGRLTFEIIPTSGTLQLSAGEYYVKISQSAAAPETVGYSFLFPVTYSTGANTERFGWAELPTAPVTGEVIEDAAIVLWGNDATTIVLYQAGHVFAHPEIILSTFSFKGTSKFLAYIGNGNDVRDLLTVDCNLTAGTSVITAGSAWDGSRNYVQLGGCVTYGGLMYHNLVAGQTGHNPASSPTYWQPFTAAVTFQPVGTLSAGGDMMAGLPVLTITGATYDLHYLQGDDAGTAVTASYSGVSRYPLAELCVYQAPENKHSGPFIGSATEVYKGARYTQKNEAMPAGSTVRTDHEMPVWLLSDKHSFFALYQTKEMSDATTGELVFGGAMLNSFDQFTKWRTAVGVESASEIFYYLPKFIGEVKAFVNYQNRFVFGGVGGIAIFDPKNLLEGASKGKVNTPWQDVIIPDIHNRTDSQYLTTAGVTPVGVHPPVIRSIMVYGDQPGRLVAFSKDTMFFSGGTTSGTAQDVWTWQAASISQLGDGADEVLGSIFFEGRGLIWTKRGDIYQLDGVPPVDFLLDINTLTIRKIRRLGGETNPIVISKAIDTGLGYMFILDDSGNLYKMDASLVPQSFGNAVTVDASGEKIDILCRNLQWDTELRHLWIATDGYVSRTFYPDMGPLATVNVSARSFVWDADTDSFWPVVNPLDEADRYGLPTVFRDGLISWSCGYYLDTDSNTYTFTLECDIAGEDPLPLHNSDEARYQPENSGLHADSTEAYLVTKLMTGDDHWIQPRYLQSLARLIDGAACELFLVSEGVETSLGVFGGTTDFATLAAKVTRLRLNAAPRVATFQIKAVVTSPYADVLKNLLVKIDLAGVLR